MSDVLKFAKKALTVGVTFTTILWSVVGSAFFALLPATAATCPTFNPGDMLKVMGHPAIYAVNASNKVLYFPSGDEFKSWNSNDKYGGYTSVTQSCFDSLQVPSTYPGAVNFRPGSYVVKRPSSDQLYVVEPNNTLAKISSDAAKTLYGVGYKVMTVADAFWPHYVNRGADVTEGKVHAGMLVKNGGKTWYVDKDSVLHEVTDTGFTANRFKTAFVHNATDTMIAGLTTGTAITAESAMVMDRTQSGVTPGTTPAPAPAPVATSGALTLGLASDNPFAATVVSDNAGTSNGAQSMIPVLKLNFTAGNDGDVTVKTLVLKRGGISADTDISNMYLYDGAMKLVGNPSVANSLVTFNNTAGLFIVAKGTTRTITVKLDLKNSVGSGKTMSFSVNDAASVTTGGNVGGSFPITGNIFTVASVTDLGKLAITTVSPSAASTVDPGSTGFEIWRIQFQDSNQDVELRKIMFTIVGSVNVGDLTNFSMWDGATQIGTTVAGMAADKTVTFDFSAAPYVVTKGQTKQISIKADIPGGTNRTFYASLQNGSDVITYDRNYNVFLKTNGTDSFTIVQPNSSGTAVSYTINAGSLTQTLASDSPTNNVALNATNVTLGKFLWKANGEDIKVSSLSVSSTSSGNTLSNVRLLVNGSQVGSTVSSHTASNGADTGWGSFGNSFIIKAGNTATVTVVADLTHSSLAAGETIVVGFPAGSSNAQGTVSLTSISTVAQNGNTVTLRAGTVTVAKNAAFGDKSSSNPTGTVNGSNVKVASLVITAGAGEDVTLTQVVLRDDNASTCVGTYIQNLAIKDSAGKALAATIPNPSSTCATQNSFTFNLTPAVTIANGAQFTVDVYGDLKAALTTATSLIDVNTITASGKNTGTDASAGSQNLSLQQQYISAAGNLMVQTDSDTPVANNFLMGATDQIVGKFKITASSTEAVNITQLVVSAKFSSAATGTMSNIRLVDDATGAQIGSAVSSFNDTVAGTSAATTTYSHATFSSLNLNIPKGISKTIDLKVDLTTYEGTGFSTTGQTFAPVILGTYYGTSGNNPVTATGASSGTSLTATIALTNSAWNTTQGPANGAYANTSTLYRARLTTQWASDTPSGAASPSAAQTVAKFVITNQANAGAYTATVNYINFNFSTTISAAAGVNSTRALTVYKDSISTTALATTNFAAAEKLDGTGPQDTATADTATRITDANFTDVDITSGASKTFYATLDTSDAASTKSLSVRIPSANVFWTDGIQAAAGITLMGTDLPLAYKTFTY